MATTFVHNSYITFKIIGINFLLHFSEEKNKYLSEIDRLLAIADMGEDFEPTDKTFYQRSAYILQKEIKDDIWVCILPYF